MRAIVVVDVKKEEFGTLHSEGEEEHVPVKGVTTRNVHETLLCILSNLESIKALKRVCALSNCQAAV